MFGVFQNSVQSVEFLSRLLSSSIHTVNPCRALQGSCRPLSVWTATRSTSTLDLEHENINEAVYVVPTPRKNADLFLRVILREELFEREERENKIRHQSYRYVLHAYIGQWRFPLLQSSYIQVDLKESGLFHSDCLFLEEVLLLTINLLMQRRKNFKYKRWTITTVRKHFILDLDR